MNFFKKKMKDPNQENPIENTETPLPEQADSQEPSQEATEQAEPINEVDQLHADLAQWKDRYLRVYSEFDNFKKRAARDRVEYLKMAGSDVVISMLSVLDDFERALKANKEAGLVDSMTEGVNLIYNKLKNSLQQRGLKEMVSKGETFDSDIHEALTMAPAPSEEMKGKVIDELEKGYYLNDKVIRHAKVVVGN